MNKFIVLSWSEVLKLVTKPNVENNIHPVTDEEGIKKYGKGSYFVNLAWYNIHTKKSF